MKITNLDIYNIANNYSEIFGDFKSYIPAKVNFYIQKNIKVLAAAAQEIEGARREIAKHYGCLQEDGNSYKIPEELLATASSELNELLSIEQELNIKKINIEDLDGVEFTPAQMQILMFMIED